MASESQPPVENAEIHCTDVARFLRIIHPDGVYEIRVIDCPDRPGGSFLSTAAGYFSDPALAAGAIANLEKLKPPAIYVSVNPVVDSLLARAANRIIYKAKKTVAKPDVVWRRWLFIDVDARRPSGVSSTDEELAAALDLAGKLRSSMVAAGWPEPLRGGSGNGAYLFWRVDLPNDDAAESLVKRVLIEMARRFNTDGAEVDLSPFDANRICKVLGSVARKGDPLVGVSGFEDRPHRRSWFIEPAEDLRIVPVDLLIELAGPEPVAAVQSSPTVRNGSAPAGDAIERARRYVAQMSPAIDGQLGSRRLYAAACRVLHDFGLSDDDGLAVLADAFNPSCVPPWDDKGLRRAIGKARANGAPDPNFGSRAHDVVDLSGIIDGRVASRSSTGSSTDAGEDRWDDPSPIDRPKLPRFPIDILPEPLRAWVAATAEATQTPPDLAGLLSLAVCAGAVARRVEIEPARGYREPINLYVVCLLDPANRKSSVFRAATAPLREIEAELIEAAMPEIARAQSDRRMKEATLRKLESSAAVGDSSARADALRLAEELAAEPVPLPPRLIVDDATAEAVEIQLSAQGGRLIVAGAEGGIFDTMAGRYSGGVANLDCFLKGHAGDDLRVDRVGRGSVGVDRVCLTLAYSVQPAVIRGMASQKAFRGRGLIGRFLYSLPESPLGSRRIDPEPVPDHLAGAYAATVRRLFEIPEGDFGPAVLQMSDEAGHRFKGWAAEVELMLGPDGELATMTDWGGKLVGLTARLAGVIHLIGVDAPDPAVAPINVDVIESAIVLARWAIDHARAVIGLMVADDGSIDDGAYVLRWLGQRAEPEVARREIAQHGRARFDGDPGRLDRALAALIDRGWLRPIVDDRGGPGRPSPRYRCHPIIAGGSRDPRLGWESAEPIDPPARVVGVI
jgi:hypothetical protein